MKFGFLVAGMIFTIISTMLFFVGYHNVDLSLNMMVTLSENGQDYRNYVDEYQAGKTIDYPHSYIIGMNYMEYGFFGMMMAGLCFGSIIGGME